MRLKKIVIQNFRNYKNQQEFDLSKAITILYGDNGNGKSSFFDAIEWCITGKIARFSLASKEIVANKFMLNNEECVVELYFDTYKLKRSFKFKEEKYTNINVGLYETKITSNLYKSIAKSEHEVANKLAEIISVKGHNKMLVLGH